MLDDSSVIRQAAARAAAPPVERDARLLAYLRDRLARPELRLAGPALPVLGGTEARILSFQLENAPPPFEGPLILRQFRPKMTPERCAVEAGIHDAVSAAGIETPGCLLHEPDRRVLGGAFLVLEHVEGEAMLGEIAVAALGSKLRPGRVGRALRDAAGAWSGLPDALARTVLRLAELDGEAVEAAIAARGGRPEFLGVDARMDRILRRIRKQEIGAPLAPALDWLATHRPPPPKRRTLVHGDLGPTNFLVRDGEVRCVLDWSKALLAEPEAEVGFLRASLRTAAIAGLGRWNTLLSWPLGRIGARVERRLAAERELDPERVRWYETLRSVALLASVAKRTRPGRGRPHVLDERRSFSAICRQLSQLTGTPEPRLPARGSVID